MELHVLSAKLFGFSLHRHAHRHVRDHFIPHEGNNHTPHVLHHRALFLYSVLLVMLKLSIVAVPILYPFSQVSSLAVTPQNIYALTNESRKEFGLQSLAPSAKLEVAALNKARDMMEQGYFAHFSPSGVSPWYWFAKSDYDYNFAGENLAIRYTTAEGVTDAWLQSPAHKANIVSKDFTEIGVAVITDTFGEEGQATLIVQLFGSPRFAVATPPAPAPVVSVNETISLPQAQEVLSSTASTELPAPKITFPLKDSFVKDSSFKVIGEVAGGATVQIFVDDTLYGEVATFGENEFEFVIPKELALKEGAHSLYANSKGATGEQSEISEAVKFVVDTASPEIFKDKFSMMPKLGSTNTFEIKAVVSEDAIRTLTSAGKNSTSLTKTSTAQWKGELEIINVEENESMIVELYSQDLAGNESRERVGLIQNGNVAGVYNFVNDGAPVDEEISMLGGLLTFKNYSESANNFFLLFVVFLSSALILKIGIKRHIQHPRTIAGAAGVMMLAMLMFVI